MVEVGVEVGVEVVVGVEVEVGVEVDMSQQPLPPSAMELLARLSAEVATGELRIAECRRKDGTGNELVIVTDDPTTGRTYPLAVLVSDTIFCHLDPPSDFMVPAIEIGDDAFELAFDKDDEKN